MITTEQKVQVAKDRAASELAELVGDGYWNRTNEERKCIREIGRLLSLPDDSETTLTALSSYINGEEEGFFIAPCESEKLCPKCGLQMSYQDEDADGPCNQWVCCGTTVNKINYRGCFNYIEATPKEARKINPRSDPTKTA